MDWDKLAQDQAKRKQKDREIKHDGWDGRVGLAGHFAFAASSRVMGFHLVKIVPGENSLMKISIGLVAGVKGSVTNRLKEVKNKKSPRLLVVTCRK